MLDCHEAEQDVWHTEVAEAPCHGRDDGDEAIRVCRILVYIIYGGDGEVARQLLCVGDDGVDAACLYRSEDYDDGEGDGHHDALDEVCRRYCHETAHYGVCHDDDGTGNHADMVVIAEERLQQCAYSLEARRCVRHEEDEDHDSRDTHEDVAVVVETLREELRNRHGIDAHGVATEATGDEEPVEVSSDTETQNGPEGIGKTGDEGKARYAHEEP